MSCDPERNAAIGRRAAEAIVRRAARENTSVVCQLDEIDVCRQQFYKWAKGCAPSAAVLASMVAAGYDVRHILVGCKQQL